MKNRVDFPCFQWLELVNDYSSIQSSKSKINVGGNGQEGQVKESRGQVELEGMGIKTVTW